MKDMHPDLEFLARNVSEWPKGMIWARKDPDFPDGLCWSSADRLDYGYGWVTHYLWLQARKDLGLIMSDEEEEMPAPEWAGSITNSWEEAEIVRRLADEESIKTTIGTLRSKYHVVIKGVQVDVYDVLHGFGVTNPADAHAIKKMLKAGQRGYKDANQDRQEAIDSIKRAMELEDEM